MTTQLVEYANDRTKVVLWWCSVGTPCGDYVPLGYPDIDFAERRELLDLAGTVGGDGTWAWDGRGDPTDDLSNTITRMQAYADPGRWDALVAEYEEG